MDVEKSFDMKQVPILSGRCLVVELPEGAGHCQIDNRRNRYCYYMLGQWDWKWLPEGNWRIIGMLSEVTEEQAAELVDEPYESGIEQYTEPGDLTGWTVSEAPMGTKYTKVMYKGYRDYTKDPDSYSVREVNPFGTALESLDSAILAEGWYFENPVKIHTWASENADDYRKQWEEGKKRVLDRSRCLLLGREI